MRSLRLPAVKRFSPLPRTVLHSSRSIIGGSKVLGQIAPSLPKSKSNFHAFEWSRFYSSTPLSRAKIQVQTEEAIPSTTPETNPTETTAVASTEESSVELEGLASVLDHEVLVVTRAMEWGSIIFGFEQANKYTLMNEKGEVVGYLAEEDTGLSVFTRQLLRTHRGFTATLLDRKGNVVLKMVRPPYLVSSTMNIQDGQGNQIGEIHMRWHLWRRKYDLYLDKQQFAYIDGNFLEWDFVLQDENKNRIASVNKDFRGLAKEIFTDANQYLVKNDAERKTNSEEKAVVLATAVSVDYDYFSRSSRGGFFPFLIPIPAPIPPDAAPAPSPGASPDASPVGAAGAETGSPGGFSRQEEGGFSKDETANPQGEGEEYWTFDKGAQQGGAAEGGAAEGGSSVWGSIKDFFED